MIVNCPSLIEIAIIDKAPIEAPESPSEELTCLVGEVGDDFDDDHESEDVVLSYIR